MNLVSTSEKNISFFSINEAKGCGWRRMQSFKHLRFILDNICSMLGSGSHRAHMKLHLDSVTRLTSNPRYFYVDRLFFFSFRYTSSRKRWISIVRYTFLASDHRVLSSLRNSRFDLFFQRYRFPIRVLDTIKSSSVRNQVTGKFHELCLIDQWDTQFAIIQRHTKLAFNDLSSPPSPIIRALTIVKRPCVVLDANRYRPLGAAGGKMPRF